MISRSPNFLLRSADPDGADPRFECRGRLRAIAVHVPVNVGRHANNTLSR